MLVLVPFGAVDANERFIGAPAALASFIVIAGGLIGGPRVGLGLALVCGTFFDALVITDRWLVVGGSSALVLIVWALGGAATGMLGDRYRKQVADSLDETDRARAAMQRVVDATPAFHAVGSPEAVAQTVCRVAIETFDCDVAALFDIQDEHVKLLARMPALPSAVAGEAPLEQFPELNDEVVAGLRPSFIGDLAEHRGPSIVRDLAGGIDQVAVLRIPVVLELRPIAVFTLSWAKPRSRPAAERIATVQRFVEHAAIALGRARQVQAQHEVTSLYRRFQASLVPALHFDDSRLRLASLYQPGEQRMLLGGDFVDVVHHEDGKLSAVVGDVTGHGPDAAALGTTLRAAWQALTLRRAPLGEIVSTLNILTLHESEHAETSSPGMAMLATLCAIEVDLNDGSASVVNAGHPAPLWLADGCVEALDARSSIALGIDPDGIWPLHTWEIGTGSWALLLYTDGLIEARRAPAAVERVGLEDFALRVRSHLRGGQLDAVELERIAGEIQDAQGGPFDDDVTMLLVSGSDGGHLT
jgi:serine phosphatase RsbU (regulator of sigma subunit)